MEDIRIDDLDPGDAELFSDDESFMNELSEDELGLVAGGTSPVLAASTVTCAAGVGASVGAAAGAIGSLFD